MSLPEGWIEAKIGELCHLINGRAFKPSDWGQEGLPIVRIQNLNNPDASFNYYLGNVDEKVLIDDGELLFAWSGTPGTSFGTHIWMGGRAILNQHIFRVLFAEKNIDKRFLRHAINQKLDEMILKAHGGVGLRHITKGKFEGTEISLPPLNEQKRIVAKLEQVLERVQSARERLDKIPEILKRLRQSVLSAAVTGKLSEDWREENSLSIEGWTECVLSDLIREKPRNGYSPKSVDYPTKVKSLTLTAT